MTEDNVLCYVMLCYAAYANATLEYMPHYAVQCWYTDNGLTKLN